MKTQDIRQSFLEFFRQREHRVMPSGPLIPAEDPTLMFANAGMVQFKDCFLGAQKPPAPAVVTIQKCLRISGKHNDFDEVGFTNRHLTFFEMLGNFSFGKYFKEDAIDYAWTFLTDVCGLDKNRLFATVHVTDQESEEIWHKRIGLPTEKIFRFDADNFWQMADTGPCGPCTELHYDLGDRFGPIGGNNVVGGSGNRFMEVWNLVFMQFQKFPDGSQQNLLTPCVDTGMGLERLALVMQGVESNFGTEEFVRIQNALSKHTQVKRTEDNQVNFHVVSDHVRSLLFLMHENIFPSNEGRGYVLRRIMRRALRFAGELGNFPHLLSQILPEVADIYKTPYPGIEKNVARQVDVVRQEEVRFFDVVKRGSAFLDAEIHALKQQDSNIIPGDVAFRLHDTFGFPIDLTRVVGKQHGMKVDEAQFEKNLERQKEVSRKRPEGDVDYFGLARHELSRISNLPATEFVGYTTLTQEASLLDVFEVNDRGVWVFDKTPFYATGGGQVGDVGVITDKDGNVLATVVGTERLSDTVIGHLVELTGAHPNTGAVLTLRVDENLRANTMAHHTATHLLHKALQTVLGSHARQQGSYVGPDQLRFDFSHHAKLTDDEIKKISTQVNEIINRQIPVQWKVTPIEDAKKAGAAMFFGEKYGENVRQLCVGDFSTPESLELCGGTHVSNTADMGGFEIISEQSIAQGIRRIGALSGNALIEELKQRASSVDRVAQMLNTSPAEIPQAVERLRADLQESRKTLEKVLKALSQLWERQIQEQSGRLVMGFELPEFELDKKLTKALSPVGISAKGVILVVYGEHGKRRFLLTFGSEWKSKKDQLKQVFEHWCGEHQIQGGGGGTIYQGALEGTPNLDKLLKSLESHIKQS